MIEVVLCDIDGCLTGGEGAPLDFARLQAIATFNRRHRAGAPAPAVTLCTGRPLPYVELMAQMIGCHLPCVYEHGCGLYDPARYRFGRHPLLSAGSDGCIREARQRVEAALVQPGLAFLQPGKEHSLTVYPGPGRALAELAEPLRALLAGLQPALHLLSSATCIDVLPAGIDKGSGARALAQATQVALDRMAGIGDSPSDQPFLDIVAFSATPANGAAALRVHYRAAQSFAAGVVEILERVCALNQVG